MAIDPKKWTVKTQEAVRRRDRPRQGANSNPELTPDHLLVALMGQDGTIVPAVLQKLGLSPAHGAQPGRRGRRQAAPAPIGGDEPRMNRELNNVAENAEQYRKDLKDDYLSVEHLLLAMNQRLGVGSEELLQALREVRGRHRVTDQNPEEKFAGAREVRPGPHPARRRRQDRSGHRPRRRDPPRDPGALAAHQEQPGADRRAGRRQDGDRRGPRPPHRRRRRARGAEGQAPDRPRHRLDARRRRSTAASSRSA